MARNVKLIWDFRGPAAEATAAHFLEHLKEYPMDSWGPEYGSESLGPAHSTAYMVVPEGAIASVRDALKPHRGLYID